ncbi:DUF1697 domain-containing protein [Streptomyces sp. NBC_01190]|uniref:DUF1697 domain-containing protein n=1 Tax=Streptomyces sp. NBC_01190 TaxID=2903767 RepID=UPI00386D1E14
MTPSTRTPATSPAESPDVSPTTSPSTSSTTAYIALLRGINVGGRNKVPMPVLRDLIAGLGGSRVRTHLQSGNAVFTHALRDPLRLAADLEQALSAELGLTVPVLVRAREDLRRVVAGNPFTMDAIDGSRFMVVFLSGPVPLDRLAAIDPAAYAPDEFRAGDTEIYAHFPDGFHNSKLAPLFTDRRLGLIATARNWNTVTKLLALGEETAG